MKFLCTFCIFASSLLALYCLRRLASSTLHGIFVARRITVKHIQHTNAATLSPGWGQGPKRAVCPTSENDKKMITRHCILTLRCPNTSNSRQPISSAGSRLQTRCTSRGWMRVCVVCIAEMGIQLQTTDCDAEHEHGMRSEKSGKQKDQEEVLSHKQGQMSVGSIKTHHAMETPTDRSS